MTIVFGAFCAVSSLRPVYSATALLVVEPSTGDLLAGNAGLPDGAPPGNGAVDGAVELMRSEPVLTHVVELVSPLKPDDFASGWTLSPGFLAFFRVEPEPLLPGEAGQMQALSLLRNAVSINRRGLTPVIAISARATTPDLAAHLANAVAEAHIALQVSAKSDAIRKAKSLIEGQLGVTEALLRASEAEISRLLSEVGDDPELADAPPGRRTRLAAAEEGAERTRQHYQRLLHRTAELQEQALLQMPDARLAAPASAPSDASFPDMKTTMAIATLFGVVVALALAFTVDGFASGVRSTAELAELIGVPTAIAMPRLNITRFDGTSHADQVITAPLSPFSESMRTLQLGLQRSLADAGGGQVVFVLSPGDGEGKTTTALGLARAFAATGQRVLLLDADVRSAALHRHVDVPLAGGFEQVLGGEVGVVRLASLVRKDPLSSLSVLVNSGRSNVPAETLFGGPTFPSILRGVRASFDVTIVDMPSLSWSAEAAYILPHADAAVVVASWGRTERRKLQEVLAAIRLAHPIPMPLMPVLALMPSSVRWPTPRYEGGYSAR